MRSTGLLEIITWLKDKENPIFKQY